MASSANETIWGFRFYLMHNPYKSIEAMNTDDFEAMFQAFLAVNLTDMDTGTIADPLEYGTIEFPKYAAATRWAADNSGVATGATEAANLTAVKQALYPEQSI
jgi:hypothetical protein